MRKQLPGFNLKNNTEESWYDLREDWALVESSIAKQYGIRLRNQSDMTWSEFCTLLVGLMPDTPLGNIVSIRSEKNTEGFSPEQKRIQRDWQLRQAGQQLNNEEKLKQDMLDLDRMFANMFKEGAN